MDPMERLAALVEEQADGGRGLVEGAALVLLLSLPRGSCVGLDMRSWSADSNFRGFKLVPPGPHYLHWAATDTSTDSMGPRVGFIHNFKPGEILIRTWDKEKEDFSEDVATQETIDRVRSNICNMDKFLAPYPYDVLQTWKALSSHITDTIVEKITPQNGQIRSALELISCTNTDRPKGEKRKGVVIKELTPDQQSNLIPDNTSECSKSESEIQPDVKNALPKRRSRTLTAEEREEELLPDLKPIPGTELRFSIFPDKVFPDNATPAEITKHHLDQSYVLEQLIKQHSRPINIIGELQFAYVCFLIGHSLDAFEYWKKLVCLFCSCEEALSKYCTVYLNFVTVLETQLIEIPEEFLADIVMNENVIYASLRKLFKTAYSSNVQGRLSSAFERLQLCLTEKFTWHFGNLDVEEDDELPVIVHL